MNLAVCVETSKHPQKKHQYKVWYLELSPTGKVCGIGVKSRQELITSLLQNFKKHGTSNWRCFKKENERSTAIEVYDFISMNSFENTHFGNLPTLAEFQNTLHALEYNLELKSIA